MTQRRRCSSAPSASSRAASTRRCAPFAPSAARRASSPAPTAPYIFDAEGKRYIDYIGSWGPMILGHRHPAVLAAVHAAVDDGLSFGAPTEREIELAEAILAPRAEHGAGAPGQLGHRGGDERAAPGARRHRPQRDRQVRGLLPRPRRRAAGQGRLGPRDLRPPDQRRRAPRPWSSTRWSSSTTTSPRSTRRSRCTATTIACVMIEPIAGNMNFVRASVPFMQRLRELCTQHGALLVFDEVMTGFRVALGGAQSLYAQRHPRLRARPQRVRQGHRRRHAAGGLRRQARGDGAARAARPGLPGRHAVGQPGRDRLRPGDAARDRQARLLRRAGGAHARASSTACSTRRRPPACRWRPTAKAACSASSSPPRCRRTTREVMATDKERFNRFFHAMLERGVYLAPALYEAGFVSAAHSARRHRRDRRGGAPRASPRESRSERRRRARKVIRAA